MERGDVPQPTYYFALVTVKKAIAIFIQIFAVICLKVILLKLLGHIHGLFLPFFRFFHTYHTSIATLPKSQVGPLEIEMALGKALTCNKSQRSF